MSSPVRDEQDRVADEAADYMRRSGAHRLMGDLVAELVLHRPDEPLRYMAERLRAAEGGCGRKAVVLGSEKAAAALAARLGVPVTGAGEAAAAKPKDGWVVAAGEDAAAGEELAAMLREGLLPDRVFAASHGARGGAAAEACAAAGLEAEDAGPAGEPADGLADRMHAAMGALPAARLPPARPHRIVVLGPVGSGKRTQCELLAAELGVVHVATGDVLRQEVARGSELGRRVADAVDKGLLVPDAVVVDLVRRRLARLDCQLRGWVLDGFPRTTGQAEALEALNFVPSCAVLLSVDEDVAMGRIASAGGERPGAGGGEAGARPPSGHRHASDSKARLRSLLATFRQRVGGLKEHYAPILAEVDGTHRPAAISRAILAHLRRSELL